MSFIRHKLLNSKIIRASVALIAVANAAFAPQDKGRDLVSTDLDWDADYFTVLKELPNIEGKPAGMGLRIHDATLHALF